MKAFQLKIVINNSKPPIWRRVVVPSGITFSQLSVILNKAMGWSGYHMFTFEFYHLELQILEGAYEFEDLKYGPFDHQEAANTYIREYLEKNEWFTYTYDLGDYWRHRVTVEKIISDYKFEYPQVIKYKGDCPLEDSGGISGYYECLDIIKDERHPEYNERLAWMEMQGYPNDYDMEAVNDELKKECFYIWGKGENRPQNEIYRDFFDGKYGLQATKKDKNRNVQVVRSDKHRVEDALQKTADLLKAYTKWPRDMKTESLKDVLSDFEKSDILEIAKEKGIKGISNCNKTQLISKLTAFMLRSEELERYFKWMTDDEISAFEQAVFNDNTYIDKELFIAEKLYCAGYIGMLTDGRCIIPIEVSGQYEIINNEEFHEKRKKYSFLLCCLRAAGLLYGIMPFDVLMDMLKVNGIVYFTEQEVRAAIQNIPPEYQEYILKGNRIYHSSLYPDDRGLLDAQGNKRYYIPNRREILALGTEGYLPDNPELKQLVNFFKNQAGILEEDAVFAGMLIQRSICGDCTMQDIFDILESEEIIVKNDRKLTEMLRLINELWNNTRMLLNRGYTPKELAEEEKLFLRKPAVDNMVSNIIPFDIAKKNKIYPNDPCPCGSGKKYKNCCKNKK